MRNIYHTLFSLPALYADQMPIGLERLAQQLVSSGRMRVDADDKMNFVRFINPATASEEFLSYRELYDPTLAQITERRIAQACSPSGKDPSLIIDGLKRDLANLQPVEEETELQLARLLVQSAEPVVTLLLLWEEVEVFISYSHTIGDLLDMQSWEDMRYNSGMQSTYGREYKIFVSCGGNPLRFLKKKQEDFPLDGYPAIARMMVIAGQELGHYADVIRNYRGQAVSRHSADLGARQAKEPSRVGRLQDIRQVQEIRTQLSKLGLRKLADIDKHIRFYQKHKRSKWLIWSTQLIYVLYRTWFKYRATGKGYHWISHLPNEPHLGGQIMMMLDDMEFNLAPKADAYSHDNPVIEEAIACVEALARVPQQAIKWGHHATHATMTQLYRIYYGEVIPACKQSYSNVSGTVYNLPMNKPAFSLLHWVKHIRREKLKKQPLFDE